MSIERISACACGLRTVWPQSIPGATRSLEYANSPLTFGDAVGPAGAVADAADLDLARTARVVTSASGAAPGLSASAAARGRAGPAASRPAPGHGAPAHACSGAACSAPRPRPRPMAFSRHGLSGAHASTPRPGGDEPPATHHHRRRSPRPQGVLRNKSVTIHPQPAFSTRPCRVTVPPGHGQIRPTRRPSRSGTLRRGQAHGVEDLLVAGAAAEVAREGLADLVVASDAASARAGPRPRRRGPACRSRIARRPPRGMPAAHGAADRRRRGLRPCHVVAVGLRREHEAGTDERAVEQHRARAALTLLAGVLRPGHAELLAQREEERLALPAVGLAPRRR